MGRQSRIKLNLGLHVPPIVVKLPRLELPQLTIGANLIKRPDAKPLTIQLPPLPQLSFGDSGGGGGGYGGAATYTQGGGGYEGDQFSSGTQNHQKAVRMEKKVETVESNKPEMASDMRAYGSAPVPYSYAAAPQAPIGPPPGTQNFMVAPPMSPMNGPMPPVPFLQPPGAASGPSGYPFVMAAPREIPSNSVNEQSHFLPPAGPMPVHEGMPMNQGVPHPMPVNFGLRANSLPTQPQMQPAMGFPLPHGPSQGGLPSAQAAQAHLIEQMSLTPGLPYPQHTEAPFHHTAGVERPMLPKQYASQVVGKAKPKPEMLSAYNMPPQTNYRLVPLPAEPNANLVPSEEAGREMHGMYPIGMPLQEQASYGQPVEEDFAKAYNAAPRVAFRRMHPQARLVADSPRQAN